jgi:hypothetical protein
MKKVCLAMATAFIAASSFAEGTIDIRAGVNINSMRSDLDSKAGFNVGILAGYEDVIGLQSGLILNTRGAQAKGTVGEQSISSAISIYEIQVPLFLTGTLDMSETVKFKLHAGPTLGYGISGKVTTESGNASEEIDVYHKRENNDTYGKSYDEPLYKRVDFGIELGGGLQIHRFYIGVGYNRGLMNLNNLTDDTSAAIKSGSLMIDIGISF